MGVAGALMAGVLSLTPSAAHAETTLCVGKSFKETYACDPGWAVNMMFMHWRMYRGHNCTNYVAWKLTVDGVPEPNYLLGSASSWASRAKSHGVRVDSTPEAGAVGTWSGRNHVVYVDQVGPGWLVISEDSWTLKRYKRYIAYPGDHGYPSKFIHFSGKNAIQGGTPTITGTALVGHVLSAHSGPWGPSGVKLAVQWLRDGVIIHGATGASYRLTKADAGSKITVAITGSLAGKLPRTKFSVPTEPVSAGTITPGVPRVQGAPIVGQTMAALVGAWSPLEDITFSYQWFADGKAISGADERTWKADEKRKGKRLTVRVTASGRGYKTVSVTSGPSLTIVKEGETFGPVVVGKPLITETPTMMVGDRLTAQAGTWGPAPVSLAIRWLRDGAAVPGATAWAYTLTAADVGKRLQAEVTGSRTYFATSKAASQLTRVVYPRQLRPTTAPTINGSGNIGEVLQVNPGVWLPSGAQTEVRWLKDGAPIGDPVSFSHGDSPSSGYVVTPEDLHHRITAVLTTRLADWPVDERQVLAPLIRAVPQFTVRGMRTTRHSSMRMGITASALGRQHGGSVRISLNNKMLKSLPLSPSALTVYDFDAKPGAYALTLTYVGPAWMAQTRKTITIHVK
jgi:surface antigen